MQAIISLIVEMLKASEQLKSVSLGKLKIQTA